MLSLQQSSVQCPSHPPPSVSPCWQQLAQHMPADRAKGSWGQQQGHRTGPWSTGCVLGAAGAAPG